MIQDEQISYYCGSRYGVSQILNFLSIESNILIFTDATKTNLIIPVSNATWVNKLSELESKMYQIDIVVLESQNYPYVRKRLAQDLIDKYPKIKIIFFINQDLLKDIPHYNISEKRGPLLKSSGLFMLPKIEYNIEGNGVTMSIDAWIESFRRNRKIDNLLDDD